MIPVRFETFHSVEFKNCGSVHIIPVKKLYYARMVPTIALDGKAAGVAHRKC
jgi:hypothetical protein